MPIMGHLDVTNLGAKTGGNLPTHWNRIDTTIKRGQSPMIVIDGQGQTGKTTYGGYICSRYDPEYVHVYTLEELFRYLQWAGDLWDKGYFYLVVGKWLLFDEPQNEAPRNKYFEDRNTVLELFTSGYPFLKNGLCMCLPNPKGLNDRILTNITLRITTKAYDQPDGTILRKGYAKKCEWSEIHNKFYWTTFEEFRIPNIEGEQKWMKDKVNNFFHTQLDRWMERVGVTRGIVPEKPSMKFMGEVRATLRKLQA